MSYEGESLILLQNELHTQQNQISELSKQVADLQELILKQSKKNLMFDDLVKVLSKEIRKSIENDRKNLEYQMTRLSSMETARYIMKNMEKVKSFSCIEDLWTFAIEQVSIEGMYLEFGVYLGRSINFLSNIKKQVEFYGFDSFEGLPEDWRTGYHKGTFECDLPKVNVNVTLIKGYFEDTLHEFVLKHEDNCAFIHVDCDLYSSAKTIFNCLKNQIKSGTIILFDEYFNYPDWQNGEFKAFQEFVLENQIQYDYLAYQNTHEQVIVKIL